MFDQQRIVVRVGRLGPCISRGVYARRAAQRIHAQAGIVGERCPSVKPLVVLGLTDGVSSSNVAPVSSGGRHGPRGAAAHRNLGGQLKLSQLPRIRRRAVNDHLSSNCLWIATSSPIPCRASASSSASCASSNGVFSAVACTSTKRPAPVMTTFISTSACESS